MVKKLNSTQNWNEKSYMRTGLNAQRLFPNEELIRSLGRNGFLKKSDVPRKFLELGCGTGSNLLPLMQFNIKCHGIDLSSSAIDITKERLGVEPTKNEFVVGSMETLPWPSNSFDYIFDVFSSCCLLNNELSSCMAEVHRTLKPQGRFFMYTPSMESDAFKNYKPAKIMEKNILNGIYRTDSPYTGNHYPMRFESENNLRNVMALNKLKTVYLESITRTYSNQKEKFQFLVLEVIKN